MKATVNWEVGQKTHVHILNLISPSPTPPLTDKATHCYVAVAFAMWYSRQTNFKSLLKYKVYEMNEIFKERFFLRITLSHKQDIAYSDIAELQLIEY